MQKNTRRRSIMEAVKLVSEAIAALLPSKYASVRKPLTATSLVYIHHIPLTRETKSTVRKTGYGLKSVDN